MGNVGGLWCLVLWSDLGEDRGRGDMEVKNFIVPIVFSLHNPPLHNSLLLSPPSSFLPASLQPGGNNCSSASRPSSLHFPCGFPTALSLLIAPLKINISLNYPNVDVLFSIENILDTIKVHVRTSRDIFGLWKSILWTTCERLKFLLFSENKVNNDLAPSYLLTSSHLFHTQANWKYLKFPKHGMLFYLTVLGPTLGLGYPCSPSFHYHLYLLNLYLSFRPQIKCPFPEVSQWASRVVMPTYIPFCKHLKFWTWSCLSAWLCSQNFPYQVDRAWGLIQFTRSYSLRIINTQEILAGRIKLRVKFMLGKWRKRETLKRGGVRC